MSESLLVKYPKGSIIISENGLDQDAYIIVTGCVEVFKNSPSGRVNIAELGPGQIFGEMALILERPRTASVEALDDVTAWRINPEYFSQIMEPAQKVLPILRLVFERLRTATSQSLHSAGVILRTQEQIKDSEPIPLSEMGRLGFKTIPVMRGETARARSCLESHGGTLKILSFPFRMGRKMPELFTHLLSHNDFFLVDEPPWQVSRNHCSINHFHSVDTYFVQDRGSTLGTIVNGKVIGIDNDVNQIALDRPVNELVLGRQDSEYRFTITLEPLT